MTKRQDRSVDRDSELVASHADSGLKKKRIGQLCLVAAVILNSAALLTNIELSDLQDEYREQWEIEQYFIVNTKSVHGEIAQRNVLLAHLNTLKLLRKIGHETMPENEIQQLILDEERLERDTDNLLRSSVIAKYLLSHKPPMDIDVNSMFARRTRQELIDLIPEYDKAAYTHMRDVKTSMISLLDRIPIVKSIHSTLILLATIAMIAGTALLFTVGDSRRTSA